MSSRRLATDVQVRREEMIAVASAQFAELGYASAEVQVIADQLGIGKATIYRQFATKEDLFIACLDRGLSNLNEYMFSRATLRAEEHCMITKVQACVMDFLQYSDHHPEIVEILIQARSLFRKRAEVSYRKYWEYNSSIWMGRLQTAIDEGRIRNQHAERLIDVFNDILFGALFTRYFGKPKTDIAITANAIADVFVYGIISETEREKLSETTSSCTFQANKI
jgi:AcrR family transcriptional regulator